MADRYRATSEKLDTLQSDPLALCAFAYFNASPNHPNMMFLTNKSGEHRLSQLRCFLTDSGIPPERLLPRNDPVA